MLDQVDNHGLDLSVNVKTRIEWTHQLHERFVEAVTQLGGAENATPKSIMRLMGVPGLTLYHLERHLQKCKLAKYGTSSSANDNKKQVENYMVAESRIQDDKSPHQTNETMLHLPMDIQRKLEAQIEVSFNILNFSYMLPRIYRKMQRKSHQNFLSSHYLQVQKHLQLRIEAHGNYLQSVLSKANEIIAGYRSSYIQVETARAELSELASTVNIGCLSSTFSHGGIIPEKAQNTDGLFDSCSTSEKLIGNPHKIEACHSSLLTEEVDEINPEDCKVSK